PPRAFDAASWIGTRSVVVTLRGGTPGLTASTRLPPLAETARSTKRGDPARIESSERSSPPWPYGSVAGQPAPSRAATSLGAGAFTYPVTRANAAPCG